MSQKEQLISELLDGMDTIRPIILASKKKNAELRSLLRRMVSLLESLQQTPSIDPSLYNRVIGFLSILFNAEHGILLKRIHDTGDKENVLKIIEQHVTQRKTLIDAAQQDLPSALTMVRRGCDLLGKPHPATDDLSTNFNQFEKHLREHLQGNTKVHVEFNLLTSALKKSVGAMDDILSEVGTDSPELKEVQTVLEHNLPADPEKAQALLRQARNSILKAGDKLNHASQQVKQTLTTQVQQMNDLSKRLKHAEAQARNDPLTGLGNRRKLREYFSELKEGTASTFLMIDIDHFKHINDQYGHDAGDRVLEKLGQMFKVAVRSTDIAARLGGEEFCIVLPETYAEQGLSLAEKIRQDVGNETFPTQHGHIDVKVSLGVAQRKEGESIAGWLKRADEALYKAKQGGRNQVAFAE